MTVEKKELDEEACAAIWDRCKTPDPVRRHCRAVCLKAEAIAGQLAAEGYGVDMDLIRAASLLHDVARAEKDHAVKGAEILTREGYQDVAQVIRCHHDLELSGDREDGEKLWLEKAVVYLADKLIQGEKTVSLERRFADSRKRCGSAADSQAALAAHEKRYRQARQIEKAIADMQKGERT